METAISIDKRYSGNARGASLAMGTAISIDNLYFGNARGAPRASLAMETAFSIDKRYLGNARGRPGLVWRWERPFPLINFSQEAHSEPSFECYALRGQADQLARSLLVGPVAAGWTVALIARPASRQIAGRQWSERSLLGDLSPRPSAY